jgi:hypothetical protein
MIVIDKWAGLATNAGPYALPPGAAMTQVNLQILSPGRLTVRPGLSAVSFSSHSGSTSPIRSAVRFPGATESVVYQNSAGAILVAKGVA